MSSFFGRFSTTYNQSVHYFLTQYKLWLKQAQVPKPAKTWLFLDEHPDSINDGYFVNNDIATSWQDIPASYHNGACGFSFADGHAEIKKWRSATSKYPVQYFTRRRSPLMPLARLTSSGTVNEPEWSA
jgi:prepilin-type processing-associated H-X9-DG protein